MQYSLATEAKADEGVTIAVRPENVRLVSAGTEGLAEGEVVETVFLGECVECRVRLGNADIVARVHPSQPVEVGARMGVNIRPEDVALLSA